MTFASHKHSFYCVSRLSILHTAWFSAMDVSVEILWGQSYLRYLKPISNCQNKVWSWRFRRNALIRGSSCTSNPVIVANQSILKKLTIDGQDVYKLPFLLMINDLQSFDIIDW